MDSFKGSLSSIECNYAVTEGIKTVFPDAEVISYPLADGGEGTVTALVEGTEGRLVRVEVTGPLGEPVDAVYGILGNHETAVIEVASACGLHLIPTEQLNPLGATTFGVGEIINDALKRGCRNFIIGLGGSSTTDAGVGMLQALGYRFLDKNENIVGLGGGGKVLSSIQKINAEDVNPHLKECRFQIACDVNNPLYGENGAASIFGPQKGASEKDVKELDTGLKHFAHIVYKQMNVDLQHVKGSGAAGGLGAAFYGFLQGKLQSGIELILNTIGIEKDLQNANYIITGEGKLDYQTSMGKAPLGIAAIAKKHRVPVIALAGSVTEDAKPLTKQGVTSYFSILQTIMPLEDAMKPEQTRKNLKQTTEQIFRLIESFDTLKP